MFRSQKEEMTAPGNGKKECFSIAAVQSVIPGVFVALPKKQNHEGIPRGNHLYNILHGRFVVWGYFFFAFFLAAFFFAGINRSPSFP